MAKNPPQPGTLRTLDNPPRQPRAIVTTSQTKSHALPNDHAQRRRPARNRPIHPDPAGFRS